MPVDAPRGSASSAGRRIRPSTARPAGPLYRQVAQTFKDEILAGAYPVGAQIPTEDDLALRFEVSRYTIRQALRRLREEGLVASRQGSGTVVVSPRISDPHVVHAMSINELVDWASGTRFAIDAIETALIDGQAAQRLGVPPGSLWLTVLGMRRAPRTDAPVCLTEYFINGDFAAVAPLILRHAGPIFPLVEQQFGVSITEVHQEISGVT